MVFWSADTAISIKIRSFSCFSRTVTSSLLCFNFFSVQAVMSYVSFTPSFYLIGKDWRLYNLLEVANPYILLISYPVFFLSHLHDSSVLIFSAFLLNSPCKAFSFQFFFVTGSFIVVFQILLPLKYFLVANSYQYPPREYNHSREYINVTLSSLSLHTLLISNQVSSLFVSSQV